jgi:NADPH2:quinone reductase
MHAARITSLDGPSAVTVDDVPEPVRGEGEVLVDVREAGVSFPDVLLSRGLYQMKPELPFVPGAECAGIVREAPEGSEFAVGDRVAAFPVFGSFAETVSVPSDFVFPIPDSLSFRAAAAVPMNYLTVHFALTRRGHLEPGETVLVHGAAGGVGTAAIQYAKALGARVIAVASTDEKAHVARDAGADEAVLADGFLAAVKDLTGGRGVDLVVDPVGGDRFTDSLRSLAVEGRILVIGFTAGEIPTVKVNRLLLGNTSVVGVAWGAFWHREPGYVRRQWDELLPLLADGRLDPPLGSSHPLADVAEALRELDERRATGKVTLSVR